MGFIELTQIKALPSGITGMESYIVGKISISSDSIISFEESIELLLPEEIDNNSDKQPTKVTLSTGKSFFISESHDYLKKIINDSQFILLHAATYDANGKYNLKAFMLKCSKITNVNEDLSSSFPLSDILFDSDEDKEKIKNCMGKYISEIQTNILDFEGKPSVFRALESIDYINTFIS